MRPVLAIIEVIPLPSGNQEPDRLAFVHVPSK
jgi:hypothetical protein